MPPESPFGPVQRQSAHVQHSLLGVEPQTAFHRQTVNRGHINPAGAGYSFCMPLRCTGGLVEPRRGLAWRSHGVTAVPPWGLAWSSHGVTAVPLRAWGAAAIRLCPAGIWRLRVVGTAGLVACRTGTNPSSIRSGMSCNQRTKTVRKREKQAQNSSTKDLNEPQHGRCSAATPGSPRRGYPRTPRGPGENADRGESAEGRQTLGSREALPPGGEKKRGNNETRPYQDTRWSFPPRDTT